MDTPQDLIKPVPPSPGGKSTSRGPVDVGRSGDGGAEFAEAMRSARESSRPEVRETQAPGRQTREVPEEASDEPVYASKDKGSATETDAAAPQTGASESAQAAGATPTQTAADATNPQSTPVAAAPAQNPIVPIVVAAVAAPADVANTADTTIQAITRSAAAATQSLPDTPVGTALPAGATSVDVTTGNVPSGVATVAAPRIEPTVGSATTQPLPAATPQAAAQPLPEGGEAVVTSTADLQVDTRPLPAGVATRSPASTQAAQVAIAPAPVALAVDRAIGNAIVNLPATGTFKPADLATQAAVDPARIASAGFVAAALQPVVADEPTPALSPMGEALVATDAAEMSPWLSVRPDSLAIALAEQALSQDGTMQVPIKLDQALQSLDGQLLGVAGSSTMATLGGQADGGEPLGAAAAMADAQSNQAVAVQSAAMPADAAEPVSLSLNAPMQQASRWAAEFGDRLAWVANNRFNSATLQINPPQLGPIEVRIQMSGDQAAVSFAAVQPQTREAIQQALPVLASSFASQGLSLGQTSVGRDHLPQQGGQSGSGGNPADRSGLVATSIGAPGSGTNDGATRGGNGLVDTFV